jgi:hypothetical protein
MKKKIFYSLLFLGSIVLVKGCTKLNEEILDEASVAGLTDKQLAEGNYCTSLRGAAHYFPAY